MRPPPFDIRDLRFRGPGEALRRASRRTVGQLTTPATGPIARIDARQTGYGRPRAGRQWWLDLERTADGFRRASRDE